MLTVTRLRVLMLAVVLGIAVASVAGITFRSSSAGDKAAVTAIRYSDVVRFAVQNDQVEILRAEVFDLGGKRFFDSGPTMGNALDWSMLTESGERVAHGVYLSSAPFFSDVALQDLTPGGCGGYDMKDKASEVKST